MNLTELSKEIHRNAVEHGFYDDYPSDRHLVCLIICELAEAVEADRNDRHALREAYEARMKNTDEVNEKDFVLFWFEEYIKDTVEDEIADAMIRLLDFSAHLRYNLEHPRFNLIPPNRKATFSENIFSAIKALANFGPSNLEGLRFAYRLLLNIADIIGMDLEWHITEKMKYNRSRPKRHGKKILISYRQDSNHEKEDLHFDSHQRSSGEGPEGEGRPDGSHALKARLQTDQSLHGHLRRSKAGLL